MKLCGQSRMMLAIASAFALAAPMCHAMEQVTLRNGFDFVCDHRTVDGEKTRLFLEKNQESFVEVLTADITAVADVPEAAALPGQTVAIGLAQRESHPLTTSELHELLAAAGTARNLDVDLLACVVHAESGGRARAVSRTGAKGLMQLMPKTAADLGVTDSFEPDQNIKGGTAYLDALLVRYHDNLALALAAYNAGPGAVDRYHGVPPYRETRAYVARIIHEFNQRKAAAARASRQSEHAANRLPAGSLPTNSLR